MLEYIHDEVAQWNYDVANELDIEWNKLEKKLCFKITSPLS